MGRKKGAKQNDWCVYRQKYKGVLYEENPYLYALPPIGSLVVVWRRPGENGVFQRGHGKEKNILAAYELDDNCLNAWSVPLVYKVVKYEYGSSKEVATKKGNRVYLESVSSRHYTYKHVIDTIRICNGYYYLEIVNSMEPYDAQDVFNLDVDKAPVAEYTKGFYESIN